LGLINEPLRAGLDWAALDTAALEHHGRQAAGMIGHKTVYTKIQ
jgi:hypothetical protein